MPLIEVSELCPNPSMKSSTILSEARDVYNYGSTLNSISGDVHYHTWSHGQSEPGSARPVVEELASPMRRTELPSQLYSRLLLQEGRGYPLMDPSLPIELPAEYQAHGVMIGDVGVVSEEGYFDVLFNICEPADGSINGGCVPEGFVMLQKPPHNRHNYRRGRCYKLGGYAVSDPRIQVNSSPLDIFENYPNEYTYRFLCGSGEGAILALPSGALKEDLLHRKDFLDYATQHGVSWYKFITQTLGRIVNNGSIYLITGCDKACNWGTASFFSSSALANTQVRFTKAGWESYGRAYVKDGISSRTSSTSPENQCIFLRGYKVTLSNKILSKIFGINVVETSPMDEIPNQHHQWSLFTTLNLGNGLANILYDKISKAGIAKNPVISDRESRVDQPGVTPIIPLCSSELHPSNLVNLYLLNKFPESDLAVTHDSVWCSYLQVKHDSEHRNEIMEPFFEYIDTRYTTIEKNGAIYLIDHPEETESDPEMALSAAVGLLQTTSASNSPQERPIFNIGSNEGSKSGASMSGVVVERDRDRDLRMASKGKAKLEPPPTRSSYQELQNLAKPVQHPSPPAPIPMNHPYNLTPAPVPTTLRDIRRQILQTEMSESLRRQAVEMSESLRRQTVEARLKQPVRGLQPGDVVNAERKVDRRGSDGAVRHPQASHDREMANDQALARNNSWANDYYTSGW